MTVNVSTVLIALVAVLLLLIAVLIAIALYLLSQARKSAAQTSESEQRYDALTQTIADDAAQKREISKRRYVSRDMREKVFRRDNYTCQICGISRGYLDSFVPGLGNYLLLEVDHITPVAAGGTGEREENLQTLCWRCNRKKGKSKTNAQVKSLIDYGIDKLQEPKTAVHVTDGGTSAEVTSDSKKAA